LLLYTAAPAGNSSVGVGWMNTVTRSTSSRKDRSLLE
jgi:hypothetical protein